MHLKKLEEKLKYYRQTVIDSSDAIIIQDFNGVIKAWNKSAERIYGFKEKEMLGKNITKIIAKKYQEEARKNIKSIKHGKPTFKINQVRLTKDGHEILLHITYSPIYENNEIIEIATTEEDINELKESEEKYRGLVENLQEGLWILDKNDKTVSVNKQMADMLGYKVNEMIGKKVFAFMDKIGVEICKQRLKARKRGKKEQHEFEFIHKNGRRVYVLMNASQILDNKGNYILGFATVIDITEKKKINDEIFKKNMLLRLISSVNQAIFLIKNKEKLLSAICKIIQEHAYKMVWIGLCDEQTKKVIPVASAGFKKGYLEKITIKYDLSKYGRGPTGTAIRTKKPSIMSNINTDKRYAPWRNQALKRGYHSSVALPIFKGNSSIGAINVYSEKENGFNQEEINILEELAKDISIAMERFKIEEEIKTSEEKYRILTESSLDCIKIFDIDGNLLFINKGGLREHGLKTAEEAKKIGWKAVESVVPEDQVKFTKALRDAKNGKVSVIEIKHTEKGSVRKYCEETVLPARDMNNKITSIFGISRDISSRKKTEEKLVQANKELKQQQEAVLNVFEDMEKEKEKAETYLKIAGNIIVALDKNGCITLINTKGNEVLGYKNGHLIGKNWFDTCLPKENINEVKAVFKKLISGDNGLAEKYENKIISKTGEQKTILWHNSLLRDSSGNIIGTLSSGEDITEIKRIDKAKTEFVSLASHQLRTPLAAVNWYGEMLKSGDVGKLSKEQQKYINYIYDSNRRMAELVSALLNVSRIELGTFIIEPTRLNLKKTIESVTQDIKPLIIKKKINFKVNFDSAIPKTMMLDEKLIRMILANILSNAVKYTPSKGRVSLQIKKMKDNIAITVKDTGYGIPANQQNMIFTKLFRADNIKMRDTSGTGLGLYLVKSILDQVGGKIWFKSKEKRGSIFYITVPLKGFAEKKGTKYLE